MRILKHSKKLRVLNQQSILHLRKSESLLNKDCSFSVSHEKWFRDLEKATISIKTDHYLVKANSTKRDYIYDVKNK